MARRRMIEVYISHYKEFNSLSDFAQLLFLKILPHTDDFGRFEGDPVIVKARVDPLSNKKVGIYRDAMDEISRAKLWVWYKTEDKMIVQYQPKSFERINAFLIKNRGNNEYPPYKDSYELISIDMLPYPIESKKIKAKSKKQKAESKDEDKNAYGEFNNVLMSDKEYVSLVKRLGNEDRAKRAIEILSSAKQSKGYVYKSDYATFTTWVIKELEKQERQGQNNGTGTKQNPSTEKGSQYDNYGKH